jgi:hypothetical protein
MFLPNVKNKTQFSLSMQVEEIKYQNSKWTCS